MNFLIGSMEKECFLCLGLNRGLDKLINIHAEEWKQHNIQDIIEKHLWSMDFVQSKVSWLCMTCWSAVNDFHQFYRRIEDVQTYFDHVEQENIIDCELSQNNTEITESIENDRQNIFHNNNSDVEGFECTKCCKILKDQESVEGHSTKCCKIPKDQGSVEQYRAWNAEICDLEFVDRSKLLQHKNKHPPSECTDETQLSLKNSSDDMEFVDTEHETLDDTESYSNAWTNDCSYDNKEIEIELHVDHNKERHDFDIDQYEAHNSLHVSKKDMTHTSSTQLMEETSTEEEEDATDIKENLTNISEDVEHDSDYSVSSIEIEQTKEFVCPYCSNEFTYERSYLKHIEKHKKSRLKGKEQENDGKLVNIVGEDVSNKDTADVNIYRCKFCCKDLENEIALMGHKAWHEGNILQCNECDLRFFDKNTFENHQLAHNNCPTEPEILEEESDQKENFMCTICCKLLNRRLCINHNAWHLGNIYRCEICDMKFLDKVHFDGHSESHIPKYWKRCRECRKPFSCASEVILHYNKMHLNNSQNVCHVCGKNYRCPFSFKLHVEKHKGKTEPKLPCNICGRLLASKNTLKSHMKINHPEGGVLPYICNICLKPLATRARLKTHIRLYHDTKGYEEKCSICNLKIRNLKHFISHSDTHASKQKYPCQWCDERFNERKKLSRHRIKIHPTEYEEWRKEQYVQV